MTGPMRALVMIAALALMAAQDGPPLLEVAPDGEPGTRLEVRGTVHTRDGRPVAGAELHVYQTDAQGRYTPERAMDEPHARLSGRVRTDEAGRFRLLTIRPGGYAQAIRLGDRDRHIPAHIHIDISAPGHAERRVQVVFSDDPLLKDPYWADWVRTQDQPVLEVRSEPGGLSGELSLVLR